MAAGQTCPSKEKRSVAAFPVLVANGIKEPVRPEILWFIQ